MPWLCPQKLGLGTSRHHAEGCAPLHSPRCLLPHVPAATGARVSPGLCAHGSSCSPVGFQGCWGRATQPRCLPVPTTQIHSINLGEQGQQQGGLSVCLSRGNSSTWERPGTEDFYLPLLPLGSLGWGGEGAALAGACPGRIQLSLGHRGRGAGAEVNPAPFLRDLPGVAPQDPWGTERCASLGRSLRVICPRCLGARICCLLPSPPKVLRLLQLLALPSPSGSQARAHRAESGRFWASWGRQRCRALHAPQASRALLGCCVPRAGGTVEGSGCPAQGQAVGSRSPRSPPVPPALLVSPAGVGPAVLGERSTARGQVGEGGTLLPPSCSMSSTWGEPRRGPQCRAAAAPCHKPAALRHSGGASALSCPNPAHPFPKGRFGAPPAPAPGAGGERPGPGRAGAELRPHKSGDPGSCGPGRRMRAAAAALCWLWGSLLAAGRSLPRLRLPHRGEPGRGERGWERGF